VKAFARILLVLFFSTSWLVLRYQAYTKFNDCSVCCKQTTCSCGFHGRGFSEHLLHKRAGKPKTGHDNYKPCSDCIPKQNTEETFLLTGSAPELKKKPVLFFSQPILPNTTPVLRANTEASIFNHHLLNSLSFFLLNESLRL
jgi:hypothetical protein